MNKKDIYSELSRLAVSMMNKAYAPYSGYKVGAALLAGSGEIYLGCNIENSAFSPTVCAERVAFFKAISDGEYDFSAIAIAGGKDGIVSGYFPPCGVCRQVMAEFCKENFDVILCGKDGYTVKKFGEMLPFSFGLDKELKKEDDCCEDV